MTKLSSIIPNLLILYNQFDKNLKNRVRADSIILGLDEDANKTFSKFVKLSNLRFKEMKSGGNLNTIFLKQQPSYTNINNDIQKDIIFKTNYITNEKKKLCRSVNRFCGKKINKLRDKLKDTLKQQSDLKEIKKSERLFNLSKKQSFDGNLYTNGNLIPSEKNEEIIPEVISPNEELIGDYKKLSSGIKSYQNILTDSENIEKMIKSKDLKNYKNDFDDIESHLAIKNIKFLSYNEKKKVVRKKKEKKDELFNINNLVKIERSHQNLKYKLNKIKNNIKNTNINIDNNNQLKNNLPAKTMKNYYSERSIYSNYKALPKDNMKTINNFNMPNSYKTISGKKILNPEFKNTVNIIKFEAEKETSKNFENKLQKFNECFDKYFPTIDIESKERRIKLRFRRKKKCESEKKFVPNFVYERNNNIVSNDRKKTNREKIIESFKKIYEEKLRKWDEEDKQNKIDEENNLKQNEEIRMFLMQASNNNLNQKK